MGNEALESTAEVNTAGMRVFPVEIPDRILNIGSGLNISNIPSDSQVRAIVMRDVASMPNVFHEPKPYTEATRQADYKRSSNLSSALDEFSLEEGDRDLRTLLLLCGDIESNPGPTDDDVGRPPQNQQTDEVSSDMYYFCKINSFKWYWIRQP